MFIYWNTTLCRDKDSPLTVPKPTTCSLYNELRKQTKTFYLKISNMPKFIELMTAEN